VATGKRAQIIDALLVRAALMASQGPVLPVAFPEQPGDFVPPEDGKYLEVGFFPNASRWEGVTQGEMMQGLLGVTVVWPKNLGLIAPAEKVQLVCAHWAKGLVLISGTTKVKIYREPQAMQPLPEGDKVSIPVNISWEAP
jgi:hypothetical protein